jgi:PAS domain S-box-containing protein
MSAGAGSAGVPPLPLICGGLVLLALPGFRGAGRKNGDARPVSGMLCDAWTVLTAVVCLAAWAVNDLHFNGRDVLLQAAAAGGDGGSCAEDSEAMCPMSASGSGSASPDDDLAESMMSYLGKSSLVLGTAAVLELFQVISYWAVNRHDGAAGAGIGGPSKARGGDATREETICTLFGWHDSVCMLLVYSILFVVHVCMMHDVTGQDLGLVFAEPLAAASGTYRPVSTIRYIEWTFASPILMILVGRSMPRIKTNNDADATNDIAHILRPGLVVTMAYMLPAWQALLVVEPIWRWTLIGVSFVGFCLSTMDQLTSWRHNIDRSSLCFWISDVLLKLQILVYFAYGVVYLLALFDLLSPTAEQAVFTFSDSTVKLSCSAALAAMRHANALAEARRSRFQSDLIADDLQRMIKDSAAPIFAVDGSCRVTIWNDKIAALTGLGFDQVVGKEISDLLSSECKDEVMTVFAARKGGRLGADRFHCDLKSRNCAEEEDKDGQDVVSLIMSASARRDAEGNIVGIVGIGQDTTEVTRIKAIEEKKDQLMAVVSHELKSPLHGIIGLTESLTQSEKSEHRKDQLKMVKSCANRLLDLVSNMMQMRRLRSDEDRAVEGEGILRRDPVDVSSILAEVFMLVSNATDKAMRPILNPLVRLENKAPKNLPIIEGDSYKITQVFYNLLTNACKFCSSGSITVKVGLNGTKDMLEVAIVDTGVGVAADAVKRIFGEFGLFDVVDIFELTIYNFTPLRCPGSDLCA